MTSLARDGIILDRHYAFFVCSPSRRAFLSGRLPIHHSESLSPTRSDDLDLRWTTIGQKLESAGQHVAGAILGTPQVTYPGRLGRKLWA